MGPSAASVPTITIGQEDCFDTLALLQKLAAVAGDSQMVAGAEWLMTFQQLSGAEFLEEVNGTAMALAEGDHTCRASSGCYRIIGFFSAQAIAGFMAMVGSGDSRDFRPHRPARMCFQKGFAAEWNLVKAPVFQNGGHARASAQLQE